MKADTKVTVWNGAHYRIDTINGRYYVRTRIMGATLGKRLVRGSQHGPPPSLKGENLSKEEAIVLAMEWDAYTTRTKIQDSAAVRKERKLREIRKRYDAAFEDPG